MVIDIANWIPTIVRKGTPVLLLSYVAHGQAQTYFQKALGLDFELSNYAYIDGQILFKKQELGTLKSLIKDKLETKSFLQQVIKKCHLRCENLLEIANQIKELQKLEEKNLTELKIWFDNYSKEVLSLMPFLNFIVVTDMVLQETISNRLKIVLEREGQENRLQTYLRDLIFPSRESSPAKAMKELTEIAVQVQQNPKLQKFFQTDPKTVIKYLSRERKELLDQIQEFAQKYGFLAMEYYAGSPMSTREVVSNVKNLLQRDCSARLEMLKKQKQQTQKKANEIIQSLGLSRKTVNLIKDIRKLLALRQYRADTLYSAGYYVRDFVVEIGQRLDISYDKLILLTYQEVFQSIEKGQIPNNIDLAKRTEGSSTLFKNGQLEVLTGKRLSEAKMDISSEISTTEELKGFVAFPGKHMGKVKVVSAPEDIEKVQLNDILVSPMTDPYYVAAMNKAGAIITDEGGILSHAAIVSRELGIPCIIGTKKATKVLNDGDKVEVDAEEGIVRVLRKGR